MVDHALDEALAQTSTQLCRLSVTASAADAIGERCIFSVVYDCIRRAYSKRPYKACTETDADICWILGPAC